MQKDEKTATDLISIVIPVLNEEKLLPSCLESLKCQDYKGKYEIIIADNGSTDNTVSIARKFGVKVVPCPEKKSVFYAREIGADAARGDIIIQADADTVYPQGWLRKFADKFNSRPEVVAVGGRFFYRDAPGWAGLEYGFRDFVNCLSAKLVGRPLMVSGATLAFRRKMFQKVNGYRGISYFPDQYGICGRLKKVGKVLYDREIYVFTSSRTVNKPFRRIVFEAFRNFYGWGLAVGQERFANFKVFYNKTRFRKIATRLSLPVMCLVFIAAYGYFVPTSPVFGKVYYKAPPTETGKMVALTFDDGPNEPYTSQILDLLDEYNVKATFFLIGKNVQLYPETAKRILAEGNAIGNHSYSHNANHALTNGGYKDVLLAQDAIYQTLGVLPHLYRPAHGKRSPWEVQNIKKAGLIEVTWSVSTKELVGKTATQVARDIVNKTEPRDIILLHDGYGTSHDVPRAYKSVTVAALSQILEQLSAKGYKFVTVPEILNVPAYIN